VAAAQVPTGGKAPDRVEAILVPLDGSRFAERALPVASRLAQRLDADIHLLSAVAKEDDVVHRAAELAEIELPDRRVHRTVVVDLDPAGAIHEALPRLTRAVACMVSHGRGRSAALIRSVASEVVARGRDPLVVVGPLVEERRGGHDVVACVDDSPASMSLIPVALRWAGLLGESLVVITVAELVPDSVRAGPVRRRFGPDGDVDAFLKSLVKPVRDLGHHVDTVAVYDPISPAGGVHTWLRERPASLVVVSTHARSGLARIVFGSVAARIVHHSPAPVLVVPRTD